MSSVFVIGIILALAGLLVPIPLMALDLLTGTVQAWSFAVLATVFIGATMRASGARRPARPRLRSDISEQGHPISSPSASSPPRSPWAWARSGRPSARAGRSPPRWRRSRASPMLRAPSRARFRRPRDDRDDGDLLPRHRAPGAVRQPVHQIGLVAMRIDWWTLGLQTNRRP